MPAPDTRPCRGALASPARRANWQSSSVRWSDACSTAPVEGKSSAEESDEPKRRIGGGVVLHVDRHRRSRVTRRFADQARVVERHGFVERLADGGELHGHLGGGGEALVGEAPGECAVRVDGRLGCRCVERVLTEVIERDMEALAGERSGDPERVVDGLAGDEAADHVAGDRCRGHRAFDLAPPRRPEEHVAERRGWAQASRRTAGIPQASLVTAPIMSRSLSVWVRRTSAAVAARGTPSSPRAPLRTRKVAPRARPSPRHTARSPRGRPVRETLRLHESLWRGLEQVGGERPDGAVNVVRGDGDEPDALRLGGVERRAGEVVARGGRDRRGGGAPSPR